MLYKSIAQLSLPPALSYLRENLEVTGSRKLGWCFLIRSAIPSQLCVLSGNVHESILGCEASTLSNIAHLAKSQINVNFIP
jgi:hypothetical protein